MVAASRWLRSACVAACLAASLPTGASAQEARPVTRHELDTNGRKLAYTAEAGRIAIRDAATGEPHGYMFYTAYRVPATKSPRPVTFVWNGGPGADSSLLHFSAVGPQRIDGKRLVPNEDTWLAFTDLVLVDPIGTGYSRATRREYEDEFYGTVGDVASVTEFVRAWRIEHAAENAPTFLAGESWGAGRAASVAWQLLHRGIPVAGTVLISGGWGLDTDSYLSPELAKALGAVDMATAALHHGKVARRPGESLEGFRNRAGAWARDVYAPALARVATLTDADRERIAAELSGWTGVPASVIDRQALTISPRQFRTELLRDKGQTPYIFDLRRTSPPPEAHAATLLRYWREDLGYRTDLAYLGLETMETGYLPGGKAPESVNERWNYATGPVTEEEVKAAISKAVASGSGPPRLGPPLPGTVESVELEPRLKVFVTGGMYDSFLPCAVGEELPKRLPEKVRASVSFHCYEGGHAMYLDAPARRALTGDLAGFFDTGR